MSLPTLDISDDGIGFDANGGQFPWQRVHVGPKLHNIGDLLLTLPAHAVVNIAWAISADPNWSGNTVTFKAMARDIPFGPESSTRTTRRYTNLDSGTEFFIHRDETCRVVGVQLLGEG
jgi:hypothetical protein